MAFVAPVARCVSLTSLKQLGEDSAGEWFRGVVPSSTIEGMLFGIPEIKSGKVLPTTAGPPATYSIHLIRPTSCWPYSLAQGQST